MTPRLLDLYCGAGGSAVGYHRAGFEVVGVDHLFQKNYPFEFHEADALEFVRAHGQEFDIIHASPVCKGYSIANNIHGRDDHPMQIEGVRNALLTTSKPYVIENVPGAREYMYSPATICGRALGLGVKRHRLFESNLLLYGTICPPGHPGAWLSIFGHTVLSRGKVIGKAKGGGNRIKRKHMGLAAGREAMEIPWMARDELSEAIPPAYTSFIGEQLMWHLKGEAA